MTKQEQLFLAMTEYDRGDAKRIQHFTKVYRYASLIADMEGLDAYTRLVTECAAILHDIGIRNAETKYGSCNGKLQEQEGPAEARVLLEELGYPTALTDRVCFLVGHHHTYTGIDGVDWQILVEADFLVNLYEDSVSAQTIETTLERIFRTNSGRALCRSMYDL